ncbi:Zn-finger nucleic acid-binding protein [Micromonospora sp. A200]|uniref:TFIIB-type zinc ribbon-containing protein n=1 Tax=Micromonospora sp. A200 TaxID=2940568 RepID=UPI002475FA85|nr:zf-TFIIB domain-containing protein [Micromonospora sp. A200]MDH6463530.1 Zn-finger nucleic acid-binding protein [Micromonospora sp. A200]
MQLTCPKCHGDMRQYERSGVVIDQCTECRGIFLDRGELEKLFEAEANWNQQQAAPAPGQPAGHGPAQPGHVAGGYAPPPPPPPHQPGYPAAPPPPPHAPAYPPQPAYGHSGHQQQHHGYHGHYKRKKHKSFLDEMFG